MRTGTKLGDRVNVELQFDADYRSGQQHAMPAEIEAALKKRKRAASNWNALPPSRQKVVLRNLASLKSPEAAKRNIAKTLDVFTGMQARFTGRDGRTAPERWLYRHRCTIDRISALGAEHTKLFN